MRCFHFKPAEATAKLLFTLKKTKDFLIIILILIKYSKDNANIIPLEIIQLSASLPDEIDFCVLINSKVGL